MIEDIQDMLAELQTDSTVPKNVKERLDTVKGILSGTEEHSIKLSRAMQELDEVVDDVNMQSYTRTRIYSLVSLLEQTH